MDIVKKVTLTPEEKAACKENMTKILEIKSKLCLKMSCEKLACSECPIHEAVKAIEKSALMLSIE